MVCATGFDVSHCPKFSLVGQNGVSLSKKWADEPESYLSVATDGFPNYFMMMGPNCLGGHGSLVESLNWTGDYFVKIIKKMATEDIKYMVPKASAVDAFVKYGDEIHKRLVWTGNCSSVSFSFLATMVVFPTKTRTNAVGITVVQARSTRWESDCIVWWERCSLPPVNQRPPC